MIHEYSVHVALVLAISSQLSVCTLSPCHLSALRRHVTAVSLGHSFVNLSFCILSFRRQLYLQPSCHQCHQSPLTLSPVKPCVKDFFLNEIRNYIAVAPFGKSVYVLWQSPIKHCPRTWLGQNLVAAHGWAQTMSPWRGRSFPVGTCSTSWRSYCASMVGLPTSSASHPPSPPVFAIASIHS